jgi:hypothetical protein
LETANGALHIEQVDINVPAQVDALHARLASFAFDLLFVNADALEARNGTRGLVFVNYHNEILPW